MRTFKQGNWSGNEICPICKTKKQGEVILIPIAGTKDGNKIKAIQTHTDCLQKQLMYYPENKIMIINCNI